LPTVGIENNPGSDGLTLLSALKMVLYIPEAVEFVQWFGDGWLAKNSRQCVVLMRGLPGSGKTVFVEQVIEGLTPLGIQSAVCSADYFFTNPETGEYCFDARGLSMNHAKCQAKFKRHLAAGPCDLDFAHVIFVDNTNIRLDEVDFYRLGALHAGKPFHSFRIKCRSAEEAAVQCLRSAHRVPLQAVLTRYGQYSERLGDEDETEVNPKYEDVDAYRLEARIPDFI